MSFHNYYEVKHTLKLTNLFKLRFHPASKPSRHLPTPAPSEEGLATLGGYWSVSCWQGPWCLYVYGSSENVAKGK